MRLFLAIAFCFVAVSVCSANDWCYSHWRKIQPDKDACHYLGSYVLTDQLASLGFSREFAVWATLTAGIFFEAGQALVWQAGDHYNGDKVDLMDLGFNLGGVLHWVFTHRPASKSKNERLLKKLKREKRRMFVWGD